MRRRLKTGAMPSNQSRDQTQLPLSRLVYRSVYSHYVFSVLSNFNAMKRGWTASFVFHIFGDKCITGNTFEVQD